VTSLRLAFDRIRRRPRDDDLHAQEPSAREEADPDAISDAPWRSFWDRLVGPRSPAVTYLGVVLMALGFAITAFTWSKVAGLLAVPLQLPYLASGGLAALGLVVLGATFISLTSARRDAARRDARLEELAEVLKSIAESARADSEEEEKA
jgi:hypothetical protein